MKNTTSIKKDLLKQSAANRELLVLNKLVSEIQPNVPDEIYARYCRAVDAIVDTDDDYTPTDAEIRAVVDLQRDVMEIIASRKARKQPVAAPE